VFAIRTEAYTKAVDQRFGTDHLLDKTVEHVASPAHITALSLELVLVEVKLCINQILYNCKVRSNIRYYNGSCIVPIVKQFPRDWWSVVVLGSRAVEQEWLECNF
jgi:hypothetical protein